MPFDAGPPPRLTLTRFIAALGGFGLLLILAASTALAIAERSRLLRDAGAQAQSTAEFLSDHASRLFEVADVALAATTAAFGGRDWDVVEHDASLQGEMRAISSTQPYVEDVWLSDQSGRLRLTSRAFPTPVVNSADRLAFRLVQYPDSGLVVGDLIVGRLTNRATFMVARRLSGPDGAFLGMVSASADLAYFSDYWRRLQLPLQASVALYRSGSDEALARYPTAAPLGQSITRGSAIAGLNLVLTVSVPRQVVLGAWWEWLGTYLPLAAGALAALGLLSWSALRQERRERQAYAALALARAQLAETNAGLEATVARRTAELREANDEVQRFAYLVSHDMRAPLVNVIGFAGELSAMEDELFVDRRTPELRAEFSEALGFIRASGAKMDRLLAAILVLAREGRRVLRPEPIDMTALLGHLADTVRFQADAAQATVTIGALPSLVGDRLAVEQVFGNLLDNAVKYLDPARPGRITVSGAAGPNGLCYIVADNGRGIAQADQGRVFELFQRAGRGDMPGDGAGLAHVRALVRALGGRITVSSELGVGSSFTLELPATPA